MDATPMNSPYWMGIVQGAEVGAWGGFHWQLQLRAQGSSPRAFGTSPASDGYYLEEGEIYELRHLLLDGRMMLCSNVMYSVSLSEGQFRQAEQLCTDYLTRDVQVGYNELTHSCRPAAVDAYSFILTRLGALSQDAARMRVGFVDRHTLAFRNQWDGGDKRMAAMATITSMLGFLPTISGGDVRHLPELKPR